jgi:hypothetical protein
VSTTDDDGRFSPEEMRALALWRVPEPPTDLAERVLARAAAEVKAQPRRGWAVAAAALVLVGGVLTMRTLLHQGAVLEPSGVVRADAGPAPEVRQAEDGVDLEHS